jgi:hypothetical protein
MAAVGFVHSAVECDPSALLRRARIAHQGSNGGINKKSSRDAGIENHAIGGLAISGLAPDDATRGAVARSDAGDGKRLGRVAVSSDSALAL